MKNKSISLVLVVVKRKIYISRILLLFLLLLLSLVIAIFFSDEPSKTEQNYRALAFFIIIGVIIYFRFVIKPYQKIGTISFSDDFLEFKDSKIFLDEIEKIEFHYEGFRGNFPAAGFYGIGAFDMTDGCNNKIIINKRNGELFNMNFLSEKKMDYTFLTIIKSEYEKRNTKVYIIKKERVLKKQNRLLNKKIPEQ